MWIYIIISLIVVDLLDVLLFIKSNLLQKKIKRLSGIDKKMSCFELFGVYLFMITLIFSPFAFLILLLHYIDLYFSHKKILIILRKQKEKYEEIFQETVSCSDQPTTFSISNSNEFFDNTYNYLSEIIIYKENQGVVTAYFNKEAACCYVYQRMLASIKNNLKVEEYNKKNNLRQITLSDIKKLNFELIITNNNGDYVSVGDQDCIIKLWDYYSYIRENRISDYDAMLSTGIVINSIYSGKINYIVQKSCSICPKICDNDRLYEVVLCEPPKLSEIVSSVNEEGVSCYTFIYKSKDDYIALRLIKNYSFVKKGNKLYEISNNARRDYTRFIIEAEDDGIFLGESIVGNATLLKSGDNLYKLYRDENVLIATIFKNEIDVSIDEFTKQQVVTGRSYAGQYRGFTMGEIQLSFICKNGEHVLRMIFCRKEITFNKRYILKFLFGDGFVLSLDNHSTPVKYSYDSSYSFSDVKLMQSDIEVFLNKELIKWQILNDENIVIASSINNCCLTDSYELSQRLSIRAVKDFMEKYIAASSNIIKVKLPEKREKSNDAASCYVYLMVDTTNGYHKIGISNNPAYREHTLQSEKPTIEIVYTKEFPSRAIAEGIEMGLHKAFLSKRIRGEWFKLNEQDVEMLKATLQ